MPVTRLRPASIIALLLAVTVAALTADNGPQHRVSSDLFGVSGGNINNRSRAFCCSGTLGALVTDGSALYILSNNHVLANTNTGVIGDDVSQPGLIDSGCAAREIVGDLSAFALIGPSNVDAAVAELRPGAMTATGEILDIGVPSSSTAAPSVGGAVAKSGRTTGLTQGQIGAINATVNVQYQQGCGTGRKFVVSYTNQIVINSSAFSAGGDSGSLIVTDDANHNPVGLLFAGSSTTTIANPIDEVLSRLGTALGSPVSFDVDGRRGGGRPQGGSSLSAQEIGRGTRAKEAHAAALLSDPSIFAVGVGEDPASPGRAAVLVYRQRGLARAAVARELDGVATRVIETDPIVAYGWNEPAGTTCQAR